MKHVLLSFEGRISRRHFWLGLLVFIGVTTLIALPLGRFAHGGGPVLRAILFTLSLVLLYPLAALATKRLHDRGQPAWPRLHILLTAIAISGLIRTMQAGGAERPPSSWTMLMSGQPEGLVLLLCSFATLWIMFALGFRDGTRGQNPFGPDPRESGRRTAQP